MALIGHWPLTGNANDIAGYNNGTESNITYSAGKIGQAASFNGTTSYIMLPNAVVDPFNNFSMRFLVYPTSSNNYSLYTSRTVIGDGLSLFVLSGVIRFDLGGQWSTSISISLNQWTDIVIIRDGSTKKIYVNGSLAGSNSIGSVVNFDTARASIGASQISGSSYGNFLIGQVNDVRIYDHALSEMEIQELSKVKILHYQFNNPQEEPTTNLIGNGQFDSGNNITQFSAAASYGIYGVIELENPGGSLHVLRQRTGEYEVILTGLSSSTTYTMSMWIAYSTDWVGGTQVFHSRAFSSSGSHVTTVGAGTLIESRTVGSLTWERRYQSITTPSDATGTFSWYVGYGGDGTAGYRYMTNLQVEAKDHATPFVDGTRTGIALDSSGFYNNSNTISLATSPTYTTQSRIGSNAADFTSGRYITVPLSLTPTVFTLSFWANFDEYSYMTVCSANGNQFQFKWRISGSTPYFNIYNGTTYNSVSINTIPPINEWHMYSLTYDGTNVRTYYDGQLKQTTNVGAKTFQPMTSFITSPSSGEVLKGSLDDVRIYTEPLSDAEILSLYERRASIDNIGNVHADEINEISTGNPGFDSNGFANFYDYSNVGIADTNLKAYWSLDEDSQDYSGNEYNLTPVNSPTVEGGAHYFNGTNQYLTIAHTTELNPSTNNFSYSFSFKSPTLRAGQLFGKRTAGGGNIEMQLSATGIVYTFIANTSGTTSSVTINSGYSADTWHHYSVTRNGTAVKVYIDGVERGTVTLPAGFDISPTSAFEIGRDVGNSSEYFQGYIKDFKYFTRVLSPEEVGIEHKISIVDNVKSLISNDKKLYSNGDIFEGL